MSDESRAYEQLVRDVYQTMVAFEGFKDVVVEHDRRIPGRSGHAHQIDVYWEFSLGGERYRTCVECKHHERPINLDAVTKLAYILDDLGPGSTGVIVSLNGFQLGAEKVARDKRIRLLELAPLLRRLQIRLTMVPAPEYRIVHLEIEPGQQDFTEDFEISFHPKEKAFLSDSGVRTSLVELLRENRDRAGHHIVAVEGIAIETVKGALQLRSMIVEVLISDPTTENIVVDTEEAARFLIHDVLAGHDLLVHDDGRVVKKPGSTPPNTA